MEHAIKFWSDYEIDAMIEELFLSNPDKVQAVKDKPALIGWFVGQMMKASGGKLNPTTTEAKIRTKLRGIA